MGVEGRWKGGGGGATYTHDAWRPPRSFNLLHAGARALERFKGGGLLGCNFFVGASDGVGLGGGRE